MQNLIRRDNNWSARFFIPQDRWADVGHAMNAANGIRREIVRTLRTPDRKEAKRRLAPALSAMQTDVDAALRAAGLPLLTDWTADWPSRAVEMRAALCAADDTPSHNVSIERTEDGETVEIGESDRDHLQDAFRAEARHLEGVRGEDTANAFWRAATSPHVMLREALDMWLTEAAPTRRPKTLDGHRKVLSDLEQFLRERHGQQSLASMTFPDVTRRMAGEFIAWRGGQVSPSAVKREATAPMGLWRWALRRGYADVNPWADQTAGLGAVRHGDADDRKRAFATAELVTLLRATGPDWAPNGGGYGATLWDAVRLALLTGLRASELADLCIRDLADHRTAIMVPRGKTKNARRLVPLPRAAQDVLALRLADLPDKKPDAPLWPEIPILSLTASRGGKLSDRFRLARGRLLPDASSVDLHSLRRSYATALETAMNAGGRVNPTLISTLMGHARGTLALDSYSSGAARDVLRNAVDDMATQGVPADVLKALAETMGQRPRMVRFAPAGGERSGRTKAA